MEVKIMKYLSDTRKAGDSPELQYEGPMESVACEVCTAQDDDVPVRNGTVRNETTLLNDNKTTADDYDPKNNHINQVGSCDDTILTTLILIIVAVVVKNVGLNMTIMAVMMITLMMMVATLILTVMIIKISCDRKKYGGDSHDEDLSKDDSKGYYYYDENWLKWIAHIPLGLLLTVVISYFLVDIAAVSNWFHEILLVSFWFLLFVDLFCIWVHCVGACCSILYDSGSNLSSNFLIKLCVANGITSTAISSELPHLSCEPRCNNTYCNVEDPLSTDKCTKKNATNSIEANSIVEKNYIQAGKSTIEKEIPSDNKVVKSDAIWHLKDISTQEIHARQKCFATLLAQNNPKSEDWYNTAQQYKSGETCKDEILIAERKLKLVVVKKFEEHRLADSQHKMHKTKAFANKKALDHDTTRCEFWSCSCYIIVNEIPPSMVDKQLGTILFFLLQSHFHKGYSKACWLPLKCQSVTEGCVYNFITR